MEMQGLLDIHDICKFLGMSESMVRRLISKGKIPVIKICEHYKFYLPEIHNWLCELSRTSLKELDEESTEVILESSNNNKSQESPDVMSNKIWRKIVNG